MTPKTDTIYRGDEREATITVVNPDGTPTNLTGKRMIFTARTKRGTNSYAFQKSSTTGGIVINDPLLGIATMTILEGDTSSYDRNVSLAYSITIDNNPGAQITVATGNLNVEVP